MPALLNSSLRLSRLPKVALIASAAWWAISSDLDLLLGLSSASLGDSLQTLVVLVAKVVAAMMAIVVVLAAVDLLIERQRYEKQLKTLQEKLD